MVITSSHDVIDIFKTSDTYCPIALLKKKKGILILPPSSRIPVSPPFLIFYFSPFFFFRSVINVHSFGRYLLTVFDSQSTVLGHEGTRLVLLRTDRQRSCNCVTIATDKYYEGSFLGL